MPYSEAECRMLVDAEILHERISQLCADAHKGHITTNEAQPVPETTKGFSAASKASAMRAANVCCSCVKPATAGALLSMAWPFYAMARFFALFQVIVLEDRGILAAFSRSSVLSQHRKGHIILTMFLVILIFIVLSFAVTLVAQLFGTIAGSVILQAVYTVVAYPLIGITQMILYYDTRIRAEGFDIEVMTGALGSPTTTAAS